MSVQWLRLERDFLLVQGVDAEKYLHSQLSQSVQGMAVGSAQHSLLLQPTGKLDAVLRISRLEDTIFVLDMEPGTAEGALLRLKKFMIRVQATIEVVQWQCGALRGEGDHPRKSRLRRREDASVLVQHGPSDAVYVVVVRERSCRQAHRASATWSFQDTGQRIGDGPRLVVDPEPGPTFSHDRPRACFAHDDGGAVGQRLDDGPTEALAVRGQRERRCTCEEARFRVTVDFAYPANVRSRRQ